MQALDVRWIWLGVFGLGLGLVGCATSPEPAKMIAADLKSRSGSKSEGHVHFHQVQNGLHVAYEVRGLSSKTKHGFHLHEKGDCSAADASSAGGHFNPGGHSHGGLQSPARHAGDLGNITANEVGIAKGEIVLPGAKIQDIAGLSVIVHEKADDEKTDSSGNSGARIACGVLR